MFEKKNNKIEQIQFYLKVGKGKPCAWQRRAKPWPRFRMKEFTKSSEENLGDLNPTGSMIERYMCDTRTSSNMI